MGPGVKGHPSTGMEVLVQGRERRQGLNWKDPPSSQGHGQPGQRDQKEGLDFGGSEEGFWGPFPPAPQSPTSVAKVGVMMPTDLTGAQETTKFQH